jgi:all-trans-retinol 13,14-reductase
LERDHTSHNRWLYPGTNFTQAEKDFESGKPWSKPGIMFVASGSAKDASWDTRIGADKKTVVVLSQCPWAWVAQWAHLSHEERRHSDSYEAFKMSTRETLMEQGFRRVFPELEKYILFSEVGTPLTTNTFLGKEHGECYGRSAMPKHWGCPELVPQTPLMGFYQTGQDTGKHDRPMDGQYSANATLVHVAGTLGVAGSIAAGYLTANVVGGYGNLKNALLGKELATDVGEAKPYG